VFSISPKERRTSCPHPLHRSNPKINGACVLAAADHVARHTLKLMGETKSGSAVIVNLRTPSA
jgi:hypothetical protein